MAYYENRDKDFTAREGHRLHCAAHLHRHLELALFFEGEAVGFADGERCVIRPGDIFLSFPEQIHRFESRAPERFYLFIVDPDTLPELAECFQTQQPTSALLPGAAHDAQIRAAAEYLLHTPEPTTPFERAVRRGQLLTLFGAILAKMELSGTQAGNSQAFRAVIEYCTKNYQKELSLSLLEQELHISKYYISHLFSEKLKIGFNDYINSLRVSFACRQLRDTDRSVTEISTLAGFSTLRTFNRAFFKQMGQTPTQYRKSYRKQEDKP